jgi:two-component system response regulator FixJ
MGLTARDFDSAEAFLRHYNPVQPGCLVTDYRMTGTSGLDLQRQLNWRGIKIPVIMITAYATASLAVEVMRQGAVTLLEKPCDNQVLWEAIQQGLLRDSRQRRADEDRQEIERRLETLSPQERRVLDMMMAGKSNKLMALETGVSTRTIEGRRQKIFKKTGADSLPELVRLVLKAKGEIEST